MLNTDIDIEQEEIIARTDWVGVQKRIIIDQS
jgi:hypothetical protein